MKSGYNIQKKNFMNRDLRKGFGSQSKWKTIWKHIRNKLNAMRGKLKNTHMVNNYMGERQNVKWRHWRWFDARFKQHPLMNWKEWNWKFPVIQVLVKVPANCITLAIDPDAYSLLFSCRENCNLMWAFSKTSVISGRKMYDFRPNFSRNPDYLLL